MNEPLIPKLFKYDPDTGEVFRLVKVGRDDKFVAAGSVSSGYVRLWVLGKYVHAHRLAFFLMVGRWPDTIDHIDGDKTNNRWSNLREVSQSDNMRNVRLRSDNSSGKTGVHFSTREQKWVARIRLRTGAGGMKHLGYYQTIEEAVDAMKKYEQDNNMVRQS